MAPVLTGKRILLLGLAATAILGLSLHGRGQEKDAKTKADDKSAGKPTPLYDGIVVCFSCHNRNERSNLGDLVALCRCDEVYRWGDHDKHQDAYRVLLSDRSKRMMQIMKSPLKAHENPSCLGCHSLDSSEGRQSNVAKTLPAAYAQFVEEGVSCVACHGPFKEWTQQHGTTLPSDRIAWRGFTRKEKEVKFGMYDLWDAPTRTEVCASCHMGDKDPKNNRLLTHEMYAAGHPPLPGFDTCQFSNGMPRHWELIREKPPSLLKEKPPLNPYPNPKNLEQTTLVVIGGVAGFKQAMDVLAAQAADAANKKQVIDLAQFDCAACHHDLVRDSWRQARGYKGVPGRPQFRPFSATLIPLGIHQAAGSRKPIEDKLTAEWNEKLKELRKALDEQPFGEPAKVAQAARNLSEWSKGLIEMLNAPLSPNPDDKSASFPFAKDRALKLLTYLAEHASQESPDYDQARQIAWAWSVIYKEVDEAYQAKENNDRLTADKLKSIKPEIDKKLQMLEKELDLTLPFENFQPKAKSTAKEFKTWRTEIDAQEPARQSVYNAYLDNSLNLLSEYGRPREDKMTPKKFKETFAELARLTPQ